MAQIYTETTEVKEENKGQNFKFIFLFILLLVVIAGVVAGISFINSDSETSPEPLRQGTNVEDDKEKNIYGAIEANDSFKKLEELIIIAGLAEVLQNQEQEYTIFAPTDSAFEEVKGTIDELVSTENTTRLREILLAHVVLGKQSVSDLAQETQVETQNEGSVIQISVENGELKLSLNSSNSTVYIPDVETNNGYIQVVDRVLLP